MVLDTSALFYPAALRALDPVRPVVVPSVVFLERARQLARQGRSTPPEYLALLRDGGWVVEPFGPAEAVRSPAHGLDEHRWRRLARNAMIAGHLLAGAEVWTANPRDFLELGVPAARVVDVDAMR